MYQPKHEMPRKGLGKYKKSHILLLALLLIMTMGVGATVAFLMDRTDAVVNTFNPTSVSVDIEETIDNSTKKDVYIKNNSDIAVYVRAQIIVTWQKDDGTVYGTMPVAGKDYNISINTTNWTQGGNYYYYNGTVPSHDVTENLIVTCTAVLSNLPKDYNLCVEILAEGIQAEGMDVTNAQEAFATAAGGDA